MASFAPTDAELLAVARAVRAWRDSRGMTRRVMGELLHVSPRAIERWEQARGLPSASVLIRLILRGLRL